MATNQADRAGGTCRLLGNVKRIEDEDVLVVLSQRHHVALRCDLQPTAPAHLHTITNTTRL